MKIYTPVPNVTGTWVTVRFVNGVGETDNPRLIKWFKEHGYRVEETDNKAPKRDEDVLNLVIDTVNDEIEKTDDQIDFEAMTPNELRDWARTNGLGNKIKGIRNKEKLLEIIRNK
jgi:hypothetical protein